MIIDAHLHLWLEQKGRVGDRPVRGLSGGRSDFGGEVRQMMPPYLLDGSNPAEILFSNMDYSGVNGAVVTQEIIDGNQDCYLKRIRKQYPDKLRVLSLYDERTGVLPAVNGFDGIKICAARLDDPELLHHEAVFKLASDNGKFIGIELCEGDSQVASLETLAKAYPDVKIAVGHFGMAGRGNWRAQIKTALLPNVYVECGGITWLYNSEFYPYPTAVEVIRWAMDTVGPDKLMWGSDYPRTMSAITYDMSLSFIQKSERFTDEEKAMFLGKNAAAFFGFPEMPEIPRIKHMAED